MGSDLTDRAFPVLARRPAATPQRRHARRDAAFTLTELLVCISIIVVLAAIALPSIAVMRENARKGEARQMILLLQTGLEEYRSEDKRRLFPAAEADTTCWHDATGSPARLINLLESYSSYRAPQNRLGNGTSQRQLLDPWLRPLRYSPDQNMDGTAQRPAAAQGWNPAGKEPYAYVWSLGKIRSGDDDALPANAANWIYIQESTP